MKLKSSDNQIFSLIEDEKKRQGNVIRLIPSENYVSEAILEAVGSVLMNKYSEGQAGKRYYQGNVNIDKIENLAKSRALKLFGLDPEKWHVNVQAVTGSVANLAAYNTFLEPDDTIMGMYLFDGGHLSHGWQYKDKKVSFTSKIYKSVQYRVNPDTQVFDYEEIKSLAKKVKPKILISGGTAYPREINHKYMADIAHSVKALYMADIAHEAGLVAASVNSSPFPYADIVTMTTRKTLRGPIGSMIFVHKEHGENLDRSVFPGLQGGPQNHSIAGIAVALHEAMQPEFKVYAKQIIKNAHTLAQQFSSAGLKVISGGTDKHLLLIDLRDLNMSGSKAAKLLENVGIIVNKNTIPHDSAKPWNPSGIRLGTPAVTTRGMKEKEMEYISKWIIDILKNPSDIELHQRMSKEIKNLTQQFPIKN